MTDIPLETFLSAGAAALGVTDTQRAAATHKLRNGAAAPDVLDLVAMTDEQLATALRNTSTELELVGEHLAAAEQELDRLNGRRADLTYEQHRRRALARPSGRVLP